MDNSDRPSLEDARERLFRLGLRRSRWVRYLSLLLTDILALAFAFAAAALVAIIINEVIRDQAYAEGLPTIVQHRLTQFGLLCAGMLLCFHMLGHYDRRLPRWTEYRHVFSLVCLFLLADGFILFAMKEHLSRLWLVNSWLLAAPCVPIARIWVRRLLDARGLWRLPTVLVGSDTLAEHAQRALASEPGLGYDVVETVPLSAVPDVEDGRAWAQLCRERQAQFIVLALSNAEIVEHGDLLSDLVRERLPFAVIPSLGGLPILGFEQMSFIGHDVMLMVARNNLGQPLSRLVKHGMDLALSVLLLVLLAPVFALFAWLISRDGGPVFYRHTRIGRDRRPFECLKFRTMATGSDALLEAHLAACPAAAEEWRQTFKLANDPRVTPVGRLLRATSLDELPQLINVLRGEMSLVGPRPVTAEELPYYGRDVFFYLETRPGMTGLWQVSGRSNTTYEQRVLYDTWYVKNWTLWADLVILAKTIPVVLGRVGAV